MVDWTFKHPTEMASIWIHGILVILASLSSGHVHGCPSKCRCHGNGDVKPVSTVACIGVQLRALPADVPGTAVTLNLSRNAISTLTRPEDLDLSNIVNFNLSQNQIRTIGDGMFSSMRALVSLDLSGNQLVSLDYGSFIGGGQGLRELDLSSNQLTSVDGAFAGMANLDRLDLRENQLDEITEFMFRDLGESSFPVSRRKPDTERRSTRVPLSGKVVPAGTERKSDSTGGAFSLLLHLLILSGSFRVWADSGPARTHRHRAIFADETE